MRKLFLIMMTLIACNLSLLAQTRTYHGTVLDAATNEPLIGATILPIGGGQGIAADVEGKFIITVPVQVSEAKVSYVGYKEQTVHLKNNMVIYLSSSSANLDDVVVVAYGTANKESLTGSVAVVGSKEIEDRPITSVTAALEGNAPGVQVNNSTTQPGESPEIRIRGFNSINGSNSPLYVVDGTIYDGSIGALNPQDIESMSILKDAASCALYGSRGANGVVLITTKRAKSAGKVDVSLQVSQGWSGRGLPFYDRMEADPWMETSLEALTNGLTTNGLADAGTYARQNFITEIAKFNPYDAKDNELFNADGKLVAKMKSGYAGDRDWWDIVSQTGSRQEYNVNVAGATDKFSAFASAGYLKANGYMLQTDFERYSGRVSMNAQPANYFKLGLNVAATQTESNKSPVEADALGYTNNPFSATMFKAPIYPYYAHDKDGNIEYKDGVPVWNVADYNDADNIGWQMREDKRFVSNTQVDGSLFGTVILPYGFDVTIKGSMYRSKTHETQYNNWYVGSQKDVGSLTAEFKDYRSHTFQQMLNWSKEYGLHHIDVLLNHENYQYSYNRIYNRKSGQQLGGMLVMDNFEEVKDLSQYAYEHRSESYLGRVRYNYDQKYFAEASIRRDGSSRFDKDNRWGTFWSVGASWIISKEKFMQNISWLNYLKLRAAYGSVGNDASAPVYAYQALYEFGWPLAGSTAILQPSQLAPSNVKWESTATLDLALEGSLFDDRFNFTIGYYNKKNSDLLFWVSAPLSSGSLGNSGSAPKVLQNIGDMRNVGWELGFGVDIIRNNDLKWSFNVDASFLKNKILKLPNNQDIPAEWLFKGKSLYEMYYVDFAGVDQTTGQSLYEMNPGSPDFYSYNENNEYVFDLDYYNSQLQAAAGKGALVEIDGKYYTTQSSYAGRKIMGTALPTVYGSFGTNLSWKGINVGMLFTYSLGGKSYDSNYGSLMNATLNASALHKDLANSWKTKPSGLSDHTVETYTVTNSDGSTVQFQAYKGSSADVDPNGIPQLNTTNSSYNNAGSSRFLTSNNYLSFKNLNISYDFPTAWVQAMKMQNLNLGFSVDNLFIASKRKGFNPQYAFNGGQGAFFVPTRTFNFQLTVKF
nr:SusC/RagA family TonB-linked outer membrane protein [uncultured Muribaculaceae bacterium]